MKTMNVSLEKLKKNHPNLPIDYLVKYEEVTDIIY